MKVDLDLECLQIILELNAPKSMLSDGDVAVENSGSTSCRKSLRRWTSKNSCHLCVALVHGFVSFQNAYRLHITIDALLTPYIYVSLNLNVFIPCCENNPNPILPKFNMEPNKYAFQKEVSSATLPVSDSMPKFWTLEGHMEGHESFGHISIVSLSSPV